MKYFNFEDTKTLDAHFNDEDVLDDLTDYEEAAGKHDCTTCSGYYKDVDGKYWKIFYSASYEWGIQWIEVRGPYVHSTRMVEENVYTPIKEENKQ